MPKQKSVNYNSRRYRDIFKYIEFELYNHERNKKELDETFKDFLGEKPKEGEVRPKGVASDPTGRIVTKYLSSRRVSMMSNTIIAIERALARANDEHRQLYHLKYVQCLPWQRVCDELPVSERTYFRLRKELVVAVAEETGMVNFGEWR